jgi:ankyrin repeat protein
MCLELDAASARLMCEELNDVASRLVEAGAKLDLVDEHGISALMYACMWGRTATAQLLVAAGAALNQVNVNGVKSALDWADEGGFSNDKVAEFAPIAAAIRARGGKTRAELLEAATTAAAANVPAPPVNTARAALGAPERRA